MKQPIYVISTENIVKRIDETESECKIPFMHLWGDLNNREELIEAIGNLKRTPSGKIHMASLAQCIQSFHTSKMPGKANNSLILLWNKLKEDREVLS